MTLFTRCGSKVSLNITDIQSQPDILVTSYLFQKRFCFVIKQHQNCMHNEENIDQQNERR